MKENRNTVTKETYSNHFKNYLQKFSTLGVREKDIAETFSYCAKENPLVVEYGCAGGRDAKDILRHTTKYIGIDYVEDFIMTAQKELPLGTFLLEDLETYVPPDGTDIIFAFASLLHSDKEKLKTIFSIMHAKLSPKGLVRVSLKYADEYEEKTEIDENGPRIFFYYSESDLREIMLDFSILFMRKEEFSGKISLEILLQK